jgi:hypothetical protein
MPDNQTTDEGGCVVKRWIIVHEPGKVPEMKSPLMQTHDSALDFLIQLALCRPEGTRYTLAELTWNQDLWVSEGGEALDILRLERPRLFARRVREVAEKSAAWLKATPDRIKAVARGHLP